MHPCPFSCGTLVDVIVVALECFPDCKDLLNAVTIDIENIEQKFVAHSAIDVADFPAHHIIGLDGRIV